MNSPWRDGNEFLLLENGEAYYPKVNQAIAEARSEVLIETFILFDDKVGRALRQTIIDAANRGVQVDITVDGYGSDSLSEEFIQGLADAGVRLHVFDPRPRLLGVRTNLFRRMHRKIVAIDGQLAFIGGINFSIDHLQEFGPMAKQDYAVEVQGPLATDIANYVRGMLKAAHVGRRRWRRPAKLAPPTGDASGRLIVRDNDTNPTTIESAYRVAIRGAQTDVLIANAYFFPGYRLLRDLVAAARRGVRVRLILQGQPDMRFAQKASEMLYDYLESAGVVIYEYCDRPLHGKVACIDQRWATVGSSNLDPFSLALNLEANVVIHDQEFNRVLRDNLEQLIERHCRRIAQPRVKRGWLRRPWTSVLVFHFLRRFPAWAGSLPAHKPRLETVGVDTIADEGTQEPA
ncbi:cardiolipin synthase ClsB [Pusillimonas sp.]|uniref:cardiolipin synthase ClsB n=1 Tax=Pusillimonas sp. TaxID=3040095 RepID=UPI0037C9E5E8